MNADEYHEQYIGLVANNWTNEQWSYYSKLIRAHHYAKIWDEDGSDGCTFTRLWGKTWSLGEEVALAGEATSIESHPYDR